MSHSFIKIDHTGDVVVVTLSRPEKRNALSIQLVNELIDAIHHYGPICRAMVFAAEGPVFSAGMDLGEAADPKRSEEAIQTIAELFLAIYLAPCVTVVAVHGDVYGGGVGLVAAADYALIAEGAHVSFPEVKKGIVPALVAVMLRRQIAMRHVRELLIFALKVDAGRALSMGVVNEVVRGGSVLDAAVARAKGVAEAVPEAVQKLKKWLVDLDSIPLREELAKGLRARKGV